MFGKFTKAIELIVFVLLTYIIIYGKYCVGSGVLFPDVVGTITKHIEDNNETIQIKNDTLDLKLERYVYWKTVQIFSNGHNSSNYYSGILTLDNVNLTKLKNKIGRLIFTYFLFVPNSDYQKNVDFHIFAIKNDNKEEICTNNVDLKFEFSAKCITNILNFDENSEDYNKYISENTSIQIYSYCLSTGSCAIKKIIDKFIPILTIDFNQLIQVEEKGYGIMRFTENELRDVWENPENYKFWISLEKDPDSNAFVSLTEDTGTSLEKEDLNKNIYKTIVSKDRNIDITELILKAKEENLSSFSIKIYLDNDKNDINEEINIDPKVYYREKKEESLTIDCNEEIKIKLEKNDEESKIENIYLKKDDENMEIKGECNKEGTECNVKINRSILSPGEYKILVETTNKTYEKGCFEIEEKGEDQTEGTEKPVEFEEIQIIDENGEKYVKFKTSEKVVCGNEEEKDKEHKIKADVDKVCCYKEEKSYCFPIVRMVEEKIKEVVKEVPVYVNNEEEDINMEETEKKIDKMEEINPEIKEKYEKAKELLNYYPDKAIKMMKEIEKELPEKVEKEEIVEKRMDNNSITFSKKVIKYKLDENIVIQIKFSVLNNENKEKTIKVKEIIPKNLANEAKEIKSKEKFKIIRNDPVIEFEINLPPYGYKEISYFVYPKEEIDILPKTKIEEIEKEEKEEELEISYVKKKEEDKKPSKKPVGLITLENMNALYIILGIILVVLIIRYINIRKRKKKIEM